MHETGVGKKKGEKPEVFEIVRHLVDYTVRSLVDILQMGEIAAADALSVLPCHLSGCLEKARVVYPAGRQIMNPIGDELKLTRGPCGGVPADDPLDQGRARARHAENENRPVT